MAPADLSAARIPTSQRVTHPATSTHRDESRSFMATFSCICAGATCLSGPAPLHAAILLPLLPPCRSCPFLPSRQNGRCPAVCNSAFHAFRVSYGRTSNLERLPQDQPRQHSG